MNDEEKKTQLNVRLAAADTVIRRSMVGQPVEVVMKTAREAFASIDGMTLGEGNLRSYATSVSKGKPFRMRF